MSRSIYSQLHLLLPSICILYIFLCSICIDVAAEDECPRYPIMLDLPTPLPPAIQESLNALDQYLQSVNTDQQIPGFYSILVYKDTILFSQGYGKKNVFDPQSGPPDADNYVRVASITKTFTSLAALDLAKDGMVSLDDPLVKYMPDFKMKYFQSTAPGYRRQRAQLDSSSITLRTLMSHTSGLPRENPCTIWGSTQCNEEQILQMLQTQYLLDVPYHQAHYSNLGFSLLGRAIEKAAGIRYEEICDVMFAQFNMSATFNYNATIAANMAVGVHDGQPAPIDDMGFDNPCGGLLATPSDMARFLMLLFSPTPPAPLDLSLIAQYLSSLSMLRDETSGFGLPWEYNYSSVATDWMLSKAGELNGYRSQISFFPHMQLGLFHIALQDDVPDPNVYTQNALELIVPSIWSYMWDNQPTPPIPPNVQFYTGNYSNGTQVYVLDSYMFYQFDGVPLLEMVDFDMSVQNLPAFRVQIANIEGLSCRWLHDGADQEIVYYELNRHGQITGLSFMGSLFTPITSADAADA